MNRTVFGLLCLAAVCFVPTVFIVAERYSVAQIETKAADGVFDFEPTRSISPGLMRIARDRAEANATAGTPKAHTDLSKYVGAYGVMAENVGTATSWDFMYHTWRNSTPHNNTLNAKNLHWYGFCVCTSPATGQKCFVVIYSSRRSALDTYYD